MNARVVFWLYSLTIIVMTVWICAQCVETEKQMERHGVRADSKVVDKFSYNDDGSDSVKYRLKVRFREGGVWMIETIRVSSDEYDEYEIGSPVVVTYLPGEESHVRLGTVTAATVADAEVFGRQFAGLSCAGMMLIPLFIEYRIGRQATLLRLGRTATATIERVEPERRKGRTVHYSFDAEGARWKGQALYVKTWSIDPAPGRTIPVLYLPRRPKKNLPAESIVAVRLRAGSVF
ncbi:MAG: hypothetical protein ABIY70_10545 [Capsulimonas sp.]